MNTSNVQAINRENFETLYTSLNQSIVGLLLTMTTAMMTRTDSNPSYFPH